MIEKYDCFIGRWIIFHNGHLEIIKEVFSKNKKPILILVMDTDEEPYAFIREVNIQKVLNKQNIPHKTIIIPPIASVNWGRNVGYETNYIEVDEDIQQISSTKLKEKIENNDESWKEFVP